MKRIGHFLFNDTLANREYRKNPNTLSSSATTNSGKIVYSDINYIYKGINIGEDGSCATNSVNLGVLDCNKSHTISFWCNTYNAIESVNKRIFSVWGYYLSITPQGQTNFALGNQTNNYFTKNGNQTIITDFNGSFSELCHVLLTLDKSNNKISLYINNTHRGDVTVNYSNTYGALTFYFGGFRYGALSDVKIYDYVLSTKEIQDEYYNKYINLKFNDNFYGAINLDNNLTEFYDTDSGNGGFTTVNATNGVSIVDTLSYYGTKSLCLTKQNSVSSLCYMYRNFSAGTSSSLTHTYIMTAMVYSNTPGVYIRLENSITQANWHSTYTTHKGTGWELLEARMSTSDKSLYTILINNTTDVVYMDGIMVELYNQATKQYINKKKNIVCAPLDSSGYDITVTSNTNIFPQRYNDSCIGFNCCAFKEVQTFNNSTKTLKCSIKRPKKFTINFWERMINPISSRYAGWDNLNIAIKYVTNENNDIVRVLYVNGTEYSINDKFDKKWHMMTLTYDGVNFKLYKDANILLNRAISLSSLSASASFFIGCASLSTYNGYIADFSVYYNDLPFNNIEMLYKNKFEIDNQGSAYTYNINDGIYTALNINKNSVLDIYDIQESFTTGITYIKDSSNNIKRIIGIWDDTQKSMMFKSLDGSFTVNNLSFTSSYRIYNTDLIPRNSIVCTNNANTLYSSKIVEI